MSTQMEYRSTNPAKRQRLDSLNSTGSSHFKLELSNGASPNMSFSNGHTNNVDNGVRKFEVIELSSDDDDDILFTTKKVSPNKAGHGFKLENSINIDSDDSDDEIIILSEKKVTNNTPKPKAPINVNIPDNNNDYNLKSDPGVQLEPHPVPQQNTRAEPAGTHINVNNQNLQLTESNSQRHIQPAPSNINNNQATSLFQPSTGTFNSQQNHMQVTPATFNNHQPATQVPPPFTGYINMPGTFNQPAPVPHVGDDLAQVGRDELKQRETAKLNEFGKLEQIKRTITGQMQLQQQEFEVSSSRMSNLKSQLSQANRLGNHSLVERLRVAITKIQRAMNTARNNINAYQRSLDPVEASLQTVRQTLAGITNRLRTASHQVNAAFNPYEAEIFRDARAQGSVLSGADVDVQDLLDNIVSDEKLEEGLEPTPPEMTIKLLKHQSMGLAWLKRMEESKTKGGILADDMGLGKTVQALALILANKPKVADRKTTVIVAPVSLLRQWAAEIQSKTQPSCNLRVGIYHGEDRKIMSTVSALKKYDIVLVSYGTLASEWKRHYAKELGENADEGRGFLPKHGTGGTDYDSPFFSSNALFYRVILDEAQNIKNKVAIASKAVLYLKAEYRLCLTGTPMQNKIEELYPIIRFIKLRPYYIEDKFRALVIPLKSKSDEFDDVDRSHCMRKLRAMLSSVLLRRTKTSKIDGQPILNLPKKHVISDYVELESDEMSYYNEVESGIQQQAEQMLASKKDHGCMFTLLLRLRQACCHQYLVEIGNIKAERKQQLEDAVLKLDWRKQLRTVLGLNEGIISQIKENVASLSSSESTCSFCYDVEELSNFAVLGECGHFVCLACLDTFFDERAAEASESIGRIATCIDCNATVKHINTFEYTMFEKLHICQDTMADVEGFYQDRQRSNNMSNMTIIRELTARDQGFEPSAKIEKSIELIKNIQKSNPGQKIIVFSQFVTLFDLMKFVLDYQKIPFLRYDGSMSIENKNTVIKQFYQNEADVLLISLRSGNVGLTLTCANHVILMDPFWNPFVEDQAMDRAHRIGQEREVHVHRILVANTVESRIIELQENKRRLIGDALDERELKSISRLGRRELGFLFGLNGLVERSG
ncbi:hypothetical protein CORT_0E02400 [Candida orthopsilosis Co 90-125]|uniref:Uncharacterized protein n=1 Tax=Candida orthopsilosis (strain 90-125) TaxID=1136231 RepID=H8X7P2_CANO9|nr:hypothetical protein CORT_0E02400 [Candida orthopsilosis Co 90-125]CCG23827.1 hypothetical protein CORT_0E02400 [Candida orthopsilosis Co 90-125]